MHNFKPKILAFAGSTRTNSFNKKLIRSAADSARGAGADVTLIDLRDLPMPLYDGDLEAKEGIPANGLKLKKLFLENQALLIGSPEYNSAVTGVLKNALDWVSRSAQGEEPLACFKNKIAALLSASPGALGGLRGLVHLRAILGNLGVLVIPDQFSLPKADQAFDEEDVLKDGKQRTKVEDVVKKLTETTRRMAGLP